MFAIQAFVGMISDEIESLLKLVLATKKSSP